MNESYLKVSTSHISDDWSTPVCIYDLFVIPYFNSLLERYHEVR